MIFTVQVDDFKAAITAHDLGVMSGDALVFDLHVGIAGPTDDKRTRLGFDDFVPVPDSIGES